jgi:hypothetical protein
MLMRSDRNTEGTLNYQPRLHKFTVTFDPYAKKTNVSSSNPVSNLVFSYEDTILFTDPSGKPLTGIDPTGVLNFTGLPSVPAATYTGDGFGAGSSEEGDTRVCLDAEGLVLNEDGSFWISDEYGPFVCTYHLIYSFLTMTRYFMANPFFAFLFFPVFSPLRQTWQDVVRHPTS